VGGSALQWGMGYGVGGPLVNALYGTRFHGRRIAFWGGSCGSFVINDLDARMTRGLRHEPARREPRHDTARRSIDIVCAA
jgi:hypothetical protein